MKRMSALGEAVRKVFLRLILPFSECCRRPIVHQDDDFSDRLGGGKGLRVKYIVSRTPPVSWYLTLKKCLSDKKLLKLRESYIPKLSEYY